MPSREEIVFEFLNLADLIDALTDRKSPGEAVSAVAAQVESMRCVDCAKSKGPSVDAKTFCLKFFVNVPHDHGCFSHEQKGPAG